MYKNEDDEPVGGMNAFSIILEARASPKVVHDLSIITFNGMQGWQERASAFWRCFRLQQLHALGAEADFVRQRSGPGRSDDAFYVPFSVFFSQPERRRASPSFKATAMASSDRMVRPGREFIERDQCLACGKPFDSKSFQTENWRAVPEL